MMGSNEPVQAKSGYQVRFTMHGDGNDLQPCRGRSFCHRGAWLAGQMTLYLPIPQ
jgi:hypothetical protein